MRPTVLLAAVLIAGCGHNKPAATAEPPTLTPAPQYLRDRCPDPTSLPDHGLSRAETEKAWLRDRANLVKCRDKHGALVNYYDARDARLSEKE